MATNTYKVLGQQGNPTAVTLVTLYTVPALTSAIINTLTVCNQSATATAFRIAVRPAGAGIGVGHYIAYDAPIAGNEFITLALGLTLATTDVLSVYNTLATLSFHAYGVEIT